jgi:hypothetical protein
MASTEPTAPKHHWSGWHAALYRRSSERQDAREAAKEGKLHIRGALAA